MNIDLLAAVGMLSTAEYHDKAFEELQCEWTPVEMLMRGKEVNVLSGSNKIKKKMSPHQ